MIIGGIVAALFAVKAERRSLEDIAAPLSQVRAKAADALDRLSQPGTRPQTA
jgi:hypothetical protein